MGRRMLGTQLQPGTLSVWESRTELAVCRFRLTLDLEQLTKPTKHSRKNLQQSEHGADQWADAHGFVAGLPGALADHLGTVRNVRQGARNDILPTAWSIAEGFSSPACRTVTSRRCFRYCRAHLTFAAAQDHDLIGSQDPYFTLTLSGDEVTTKVSDAVSYQSDALSAAGACVLRDRNCPLPAPMEIWVDHMHC